MYDILVVFVHLMVTIVRFMKPGGLRAVVAESAHTRLKNVIRSFVEDYGERSRRKLVLARKYDLAGYVIASSKTTGNNGSVEFATLSAVGLNRGRPRAADRTAAARRSHSQSDDHPARHGAGPDAAAAG